MDAYTTFTLAHFCGPARQLLSNHAEETTPNHSNANEEVVFDCFSKREYKG